jgi:hypothetical protein
MKLRFTRNGKIFYNSRWWNVKSNTIMDFNGDELLAQHFIDEGIAKKIKT